MGREELMRKAKWKREARKKGVDPKKYAQQQKAKSGSNWEGKNSTWVSGKTNKIIAPKSGSNLRAGKDYDDEVKRQKSPFSKTNRQKLLSNVKNWMSKNKQRRQSGSMYRKPDGSKR